MQAHALPNVLNTIGIGEVVLIAPEGPHAIAGGLAQVMNGLLKTFSQSGVPVTFIAPLYEYAQGSKHDSAEHVLRNGLWIDDQCFKVRHVGEVDIPFGPTYRSNSGEWMQHPHTVNSAVYMAECGDIRIFLLRHKRYADRLYPTLMPDEHLRRAIFLARGALEVMRCPLFDIQPQLVLSNDWLSALVPVFMKLDSRYSEDPILNQARTVHLIHNCGRDYHGRIPARHNGQELFPMLELDPFHYKGLTDPKDGSVMNLTAAAIYHLDGALLAVSKPYAQALMTWDGGEGLHDLVWNKRQSVFGISNAVDQGSVRRTVVGIGEDCLARLDEAIPPDSDPSDAENFVHNLPTYKQAAKRVIQSEMGLEVDPNKVLISFIGRLAEQKGIQLLSNNADGDHVSVLESILQRYPQAQIVVAGPAVEGDSLATQFCGLIEHLRRFYPGRIAGIYDFVHHDYALKIFTASDLSLMPSRYEPGGLTQLESLACGTLVVARNVGGLSATLQRFDDEAGRGNGFLFDDYTSTALRNTICWALDRTRDNEFRWELIREAAMAQHDWSHRLPQYLSIFQHITGVLSNEHQYKHLEGRASLLACLRA
jgi:starch synthase